MGKVLLILWVYGNGLIVILMRHEVPKLWRITMSEDDRMSGHHGHVWWNEGDQQRVNGATPVGPWNDRGLCIKSCIMPRKKYRKKGERLQTTKKDMARGERSVATNRGARLCYSRTESESLMGEEVENLEVQNGKKTVWKA